MQQIKKINKNRQPFIFGNLISSRFAEIRNKELL